MAFVTILSRCREKFNNSLTGTKIKEISFANRPMVICLQANASVLIKAYLKEFLKIKILFYTENMFLYINIIIYIFIVYLLITGRMFT